MGIDGVGRRNTLDRMDGMDISNGADGMGGMDRMMELVFKL